MAAVALVTGSARGIGRAIALRLADDGFHVAINDVQQNVEDLLDLKHEIERKGKQCAVVPGDVSVDSAVVAMIENTAQMLGRLDVMVANAGIIRVKPLLETSVDEWDQVQAVNARGVFLCYKHAAEQMIKQKTGGKIIGACSIAGYRPSTIVPAYSVSKWAVRGLTQVAAMEFAQHGITVNAYCPGIVSTEMWDAIERGVAERRDVPKGTVLEEAVGRSALKRDQTPEDIAGLVSFLAGKDSNQITGQSMIVDGGSVYS